MKNMLVIFVCVLGLSACLKDEVPFKYTISVNVMDKETSEAINGADVYLYAVTGSTSNKIAEQKNVNTHCEFSGLEQIGKYEVLVIYKPEDYKNGEGNVTLNDSAKNTLNIFLEPL